MLLSYSFDFSFAACEEDKLEGKENYEVVRNFADFLLFVFVFSSKEMHSDR